VDASVWIRQVAILGVVLLSDYACASSRPRGWSVPSSRRFHRPVLSKGARPQATVCPGGSGRPGGHRARRARRFADARLHRPGLWPAPPPRGLLTAVLVVIVAARLYFAYSAQHVFSRPARRVAVDQPIARRADRRIIFFSVAHAARPHRRPRPARPPGRRRRPATAGAQLSAPVRYPTGREAPARTKGSGRRFVMSR